MYDCCMWVTLDALNRLDMGSTCQEISGLLSSQLSSDSDLHHVKAPSYQGQLICHEALTCHFDVSSR